VTGIHRTFNSVSICCVVCVSLFSNSFDFIIVNVSSMGMLT
jgi:hypothetical protein